MPKPLLAIIGRPNVGKSTFFNRLIGKRLSIVENEPGVTRDRVYADAQWLDRDFSVVDTGGLDPSSQELLVSDIRRQAQIAIETADVVLFIVDGKQGMTALDEAAADLLRRSKKPLVLAVNKVDSFPNHEKYFDFYSLGLGDPIPCSASHGLGFEDVMEAVLAHFPAAGGESEERHAVSIAVVGKPNAGKSSLVNRLLGQQRVIVSDIPGTTRDAIDTPFRHHGEEYLLIDTAGIRRKRSIEDASVERYSIIRALGAIRRCDVALLVIDAEAGITEQDVKIAGYIHQEGRACVILINKWDVLEKQTGTLEAFRAKVLEELKFMAYVPVLFISAKTGQRVSKVMELVQFVYGQSVMRISTGTLNDVLADAMAVTEPPTSHGKRLKIYYATQTGIQPPTFVLFLNDRELMHYSYERYLENHFRKTFGLEGTPIRFILRDKGDKEA